MITALALGHFHWAGAEVAVIETGLGGRLDASNVLKPCLTITTQIDRDHMEILGSTLRKIAVEKAGIIKPGVPHLVGTLPPVAEKVMRETCRRRGAPYHDLVTGALSANDGLGCLDYRGETINVNGIRLALKGEHQLRNCHLTLRAVEILKDTGFVVNNPSIKKGLSGVNWAGRFQVIRKADAPDLVLDVCHNASGAGAFAETFASEYPGKKTEIILGLVKRKEHQRVISALSRIASCFWLVPLKTKRSTETSELIESLDWRGIPVRRCGRLATAYSRLLKTAVTGDIISIIGSHYLVGEFLKNYRPR